MGKFLTSHSRLEQLDIPEKWKTVDNLLYKCNDGKIILCPRNTITDGYTIPSVVAWFAGSKMKWDTRASSQHDFECYYHKYIQVMLTEFELRKIRLLHSANSIEICENIPLEYLCTKNTTFCETNERFLEMLYSVQSIPEWRKKILGYGVYLNANWIREPYHWDKNMAYKVNYGLLKF